MRPYMGGRLELVIISISNTFEYGKFTLGI